jgi:hypothetical protein
MLFSVYRQGMRRCKWLFCLHIIKCIGILNSSSSCVNNLSFDRYVPLGLYCCDQGERLFSPYSFRKPVEVMKQIKNNEISVGGCLIEEDSPKWECRECKNQFGKVNMYYIRNLKLLVSMMLGNFCIDLNFISRP